MDADSRARRRDSADAHVDTFLFPMSFAQQRLWFLDQISPGNPFYNIPLSIPLAGRVDADAIERALNGIIRRHESLRTTFRVIDGEPSQVISAGLTIDLARHRLDHLPATDRAAALEQIATHDARAPFDLRTGPLVRAALVRRNTDDHVLVLTIHHIVADGWSVGILFRELTALYTAYAAGQASPLPDLPLQYADFTMWQRDRLRGERLEALMSFWRTKLLDLPVLAMPTDRPRPRVLDYTGAYVPVEIPVELALGARTLSRSEHVTPFMTLMAAFVSLLSRYTAQDDIVVGTPIANRNQADTEQIIGFFVNSLILRCDLTGQPTFREVLQRVRDECLDAYAHQDLPFERLVEDLKPDRDLSRNPLFQVTFQLVNTPTTGGGTSAGASPPPAQRGSAIFDLAFTLVDSDGPLRGMIEFSTQLFDAATIARFIAHYRILLRAALADPDVRVSDISLTTRAERELLVAQRVAPVANAPTVTEAVRTTVRATPNSLAVVSGDDRLTFAGLHERANSVADRLRCLGIGVGDRVALVSDGSPWLPAAMLGVLRVGAAYLPIDPNQPTARVAYVLNDAAPAALLTDTTVHAQLPATDVPIVWLDLADGHADTKFDADAIDDDTIDNEAVAGSHAAYVLYTSGSSGRPKGVVIPRSALDNHMAWMLSEFSIDPTDRILQRTTTIFDASVWEFWAPMMSGARLVLLSDAAKRDPSEIAAAVRHHEITVLQVVPSLLRALLDEPDFVTSDTLRLVFCGGEQLSGDLRDQFMRTLGAPLINLYGPTEATIDATAYRCTPTSGPTVPIGRPIAGSGALVLDRAGRPTPIGVPGELYLSGAGLALGYVGRPRLTAERFVPDEFSGSPGDRLYATGDLARFRTDGNLEYLGRGDQQVKVRGHRVELGEIERALESCSGVRRAVAAVHHDRIVAFLTPEASHETVTDLVDEVEREVLDHWEDVYEQIYGELSHGQHDDLNTVGWTSSYTGERINDEAMQAWREQTVQRILALRPRRVLEIGCGTGMILARLAPTTERYVGTDLSAPALRYVEDYLARLPDSPANVELLHRPAHELDDLAGGEFDMVVLNSVVQYFPSVHYLRRVLDGALRCVRPGGVIFVGDVRSLPLLDAFHATVEFARAHDAQPTSELLRRIEDAVSKEEELVLAPEYFIDLAQRHDGIARCDALLKRTGHINEMSLFRYDVLIHVGPDDIDPPVLIRLDWRRHRLDANQLDARLAQTTDDCIVVGGIPDGELTGSLASLAMCRKRQHGATVATLRAITEGGCGGVTSATLMRIAERTGYEVTLRPSIGDPPGHIEAVFTRRGTDPGSIPLPQVERVEQLSNEPESGPTAARLIPTVRAELDRVLPDYMSPAQYIVLTDLPLLPNGKIDRAGLPVPTDRAVSRITPFVAAADPLEQVLVEVWSDVIGVDSLGTHDDFFRELGGHSLLAARLVARLRAELSVNVPLQLVFDAPRVVDMAAVLRADVHDSQAVDPTASATGDVDSPPPEGEARHAMAGATGARRTEAQRGG